MYKHPIKEPRWQTDATTRTLQELRGFSPGYIVVTLGRKPLDEKQIIVEVEWESANEPTTVRYFDLTDEMVDFKIRGKEYQLRFRTDPLIEYLKSRGVTDDTEVKFYIRYTVR